MELSLDQQKQHDIVCPKNNPSKHSCLNKTCQKNAFVCEETSCECRKQHKGCLMVQTSTIANCLSSKVISIQPLEEILDKQVEKIIDHLSDLRDNWIADIKSKFQYCGLNQKYKNFFKMLKSSKTPQITGSQLWEFHLDLEPAQGIVEYMKTHIQAIKDQFKDFDLQVNSLSFEITQKISTFSKISQRCVQIKEEINSTKQQINRQSNLTEYCPFAQSKVVKTFDQNLAIEELLAPRVIKKLNLAYRATQNNFETIKFHQKCANLTPILIVCETEFNKKIGAYTALTWQGLAHSEYRADESKQTFLFSLTNKDKFVLQKKQKAIEYSDEYGPKFGTGSDFAIKNKANEVNSSYAKLNNAYFNGNYKSADKQSYEKFSGNPNDQQYFKIKEWEVWNVEFQE